MNAIVIQSKNQFDMILAKLSSLSAARLRKLDGRFKIIKVMLFNFSGCFVTPIPIVATFT